MANHMAKAPITMIAATSTLASSKMANVMVMAPNTVMTAASITLASGRMAYLMVKAPNTVQTTASG